MLGKAAILATALIVGAAPLAHAQSSRTVGKVSATDATALTDARVDLTKAALQLTADQEKYWPPIEQAIRARAKDRQARLAEIATQLGDKSPIEIIRDRNPVEFMQRRADALAQRAADLKKLSEAWEPLYKTLTPEQKKRMAFVTLVVAHEIGDAIEQRHIDAMDDDAAF
jgi:LTXXQ motif family protein